MNELQGILKFLQKYFKEPIEFEGIIFQYFDIEIEEGFADAFRFNVNVILPKENQSYLAQVLDSLIQDQIYEAYKFIGKTYSYTIVMDVNDEEIFNNTFTFINKESLSEIIKKCNDEFGRIGITVFEGEKTLDMSCRLSWDKVPYDGIHENVNFYMKMELSDFELDKTPVIPNPEKLNDVAGTLWSLLVDRDWFLPKMEDYIYEVISPETKIDKVEDVYAQVFIRVNRLNGIRVKQEERYGKIQTDFFITDS